MKNEMQSPLIAAEACDMLRVSTRTLYRYVRARKLAAIKLDGKLLFERTAIERFKEKRTCGPRSSVRLMP